MRLKLPITMNSLRFAVILLVSTTILPFIECMYEDQVGKIDWTQHYVGKAVGGFFDSANGQLVVGTEQNVLAAINTRSGSIEWRRIFEKGDRGTIQFIDELPDSPNSKNALKNALTITGTTVSLIRLWNTRSGDLISEWTLNNPNAAPAKAEHWFVSETLLYRVVLAHGSSKLDVTAYDVKTGTVESNKDVAVQSNDCQFAKSFVICLSNGKVVATNIVSGETKIVGESSTTPRVLHGNSAVIGIGNVVYNLESGNNFNAALLPSNSYYNIKTDDGNTVLIQALSEKTKLRVDSLSAPNAGSFPSTTVEQPDHLGSLRIVDAVCKTEHNRELNCRVLFVSENGALFVVASNEITWLREESLADIAALEMIDLPLSDDEGDVEKLIKHANGDVLTSFLYRIGTQFIHFKHLARTLFNAVSTHQIPEQGQLTRDAFGLHTMIVVVTTSGKLFGVDNKSGRIHYAVNLSDFARFNNDQGMKIVVQRTSKHFPYAARCAIIAKHKSTGNGLIYQFDPIDGSSVDGGIIQLPYKIQQLAVLQPGADYLRGALLLDENNGVHVYPKQAESAAPGTYIYVSNTETGIMTGHYIEADGEQLKAIETWRINLSGLDNSQKIIKIASKNSNEHVHSQGRVLYDRSVLYKYINPNLVAVVTEGNDNQYKYVLNVHMIDVVSGGIVSTLTHRRAKGPVHIIHSENWLVYTYYNDKARRTELTSVELYEGTTQANSTVWTSFDAPPLPTIEQQAFIIPATVVSLRETITEKGITSKHVLIGLSSGAIVEMPWHLLDPRRPTPNSNQPREEGTVPYMPELPLSSESIINYNQSVGRIKDIYTAPSGLESTCLVIAHGLDFFTVRISPSRTFDLLKDDFDYFTLSTVLLGLTIASFVVKQMSVKKALKQAWK